jgi:hypothetical protein
MINKLLRIINILDINCIKINFSDFFQIASFGNSSLIQICTDRALISNGYVGEILDIKIFADFCSSGAPNNFVAVGKSDSYVKSMVDWSSNIDLSYLEGDFDKNLIERLFKLQAFS